MKGSRSSKPVKINKNHNQPIYYEPLNAMWFLTVFGLVFLASVTDVKMVVLCFSR